MRTLGLLLLIFLAPAACSHLPRLQDVPPGMDREIRRQCFGIYPQGEWQMVHAIEAVMPDGTQATLMGITQLSSPQRTLDCVLLTLEGMVLFEARYAGGRIDVLRALPPFDAPGFSQGIFDDIRLLLLPPEEPPAMLGRKSGEELVCRWRLPDGYIQDNVLFTDQSWEIRRYNEAGRLVRRITAAGGGREEDRPLPDVVTLKAFGLLGYELTLTLLEAQTPQLSYPTEKASS